MRTILAIVVTLLLGVFTIEGRAAAPSGYNLAWSEEFSGTTLNSNSWSPRTDTISWSYYASNVGVSNGNLLLTATNTNGIKYGGVISKDKYSFKYGYIEIRAKVPKGKGLLSGLWLTGQDHWPPELDILEYLGNKPNTILMTLHCSTYLDSTCSGGTFLDKPWWKYVPREYVGIDWSLDYHNYGLEWTPQYVRWLIDGVERHRVTTGVPKEPMWITLSTCADNCAGGWSGPIDSSTNLPSKMYVDYVRIYKQSPTSSAITTVSPNGGESLQIGTTRTINWASSGDTGPYVKVELLKGGTLNKVITSSTSNSGSHAWTIPSTQPIGNDYKIKITSTSNSLHTDTSNSNFVIVAPTTGTQTSITLSSPNSGESWKRGAVYEIKWTYTGSPGSYVKIELLKGGSLNRVISSSTANDKSFWWTISPTQTLGSDYKIRITSTSNGAYVDTSNNNFKIY